MAKYYVTMGYITHFVVEVDAENAEQALEIANETAQIPDDLTPEEVMAVSAEGENGDSACW